MKVVTADQMRQIDQECGNIALPANVLMENAGKAVAEEVRRILGTIDRQRIIILIGPGNNGGDGLVAARYLHDWGASVGLYLFGQRPPDDPNLKLVQERSITCMEAAQDENMDSLDGLLSSATAVIDALFGTGRSRPLGDTFVQALDRVGKAKERQTGLRIIALDLPSGLNADSGAVDSACLYADNTITLGFPKAGLFNPPGAERAGKITVADIGIPSSTDTPASLAISPGCGVSIASSGNRCHQFAVLARVLSASASRTRIGEGDFKRKRVDLTSLTTDWLCPNPQPISRTS